MPAKTPSEWVEIIDDALVKIISGTVSNYSVAGRSFTKHDISQLQDLRDYWASIDASKRSGFTTRANFTNSQ